MHPQDLEPEMEQLLHWLAPDLDSQWQGATEAEIAQVEELCPVPLPRFYRWFLMRMGRSMGPFAHPSLDFSAPTIIECYTSGLIEPDADEFLIGYETDPRQLGLHVFYDFQHPARDDARVAKGEDWLGPSFPEFETFREMIGWGKFLMRRIKTFPCQCAGFLSFATGEILPQLTPVMESLGFRTLIPTGRLCALYEGGRAAMATSSSLAPEVDNHVIEFGAESEELIRRVLGEIVSETDLEFTLMPNDPYV
jgi:hypothetical protein